MINDKKRLGGILSIILVICLIFSSFSYALNSKPNINVSEFNTINKLAAVSETNAFVMTTSSLYSPWLQGYSEKQKDNIQGIKCTTLLYQENNNKIYRYEC